MDRRVLRAACLYRSISGCMVVILSDFKEAPELHWHLHVSMIRVEIFPYSFCILHYNDVTMGSMASQITSLTIVYSAVYKKTSKLCVTGLCDGNSPESDEFPVQMASNAENVSIWWRHHGYGAMTSMSASIWWIIFPHFIVWLVIVKTIAWIKYHQRCDHMRSLGCFKTPMSFWI